MRQCRRSSLSKFQRTLLDDPPDHKIECAAEMEVKHSMRENVFPDRVVMSHAINQKSQCYRGDCDPKKADILRGAMPLL